MRLMEGEVGDTLEDNAAGIAIVRTNHASQGGVRLSESIIVVATYVNNTPIILIR